MRASAEINTTNQINEQYLTNFATFTLFSTSSGSTFHVRLEENGGGVRVRTDKTSAQIRQIGLQEIVIYRATKETLRTTYVLI